MKPCSTISGLFIRSGIARSNSNSSASSIFPLKRKLKHLSRGMRMKAAFAASLAYRPKLIVLDEPFSGLDPLVRDELIEGLLDRAPETTIFLSSHDLAEIESFASHVGYLENGRMLFSEEMSVLSDRFREMTITLTPRRRSRRRFHPTWLQLEAGDSVIRFVDSNFRGQETAEELAEIFPSASDIAIESMPLRSIFLAIAKTGRTRPNSLQTSQVSEGPGKGGSMKQMLHIFAKDTRQFWPEILISLALVATFVWIYPQQLVIGERHLRRRWRSFCSRPY